MHEESISGSGRTREEYRNDRRRIFEKAIGRRFGARDCYERAARRAWKWISRSFAAMVSDVGEVGKLGVSVRIGLPAEGDLPSAILQLLRNAYESLSE